MSGEYTPTVVQSGGPTPPPDDLSRFSITLNFIHGSLAGTSQSFTLPFVRFGRGPDNDLRFDPSRDTKVSTRHGQLRLDTSSGQWFVEDLGSTNGTFIDGTRIDSPAALASGMTVVLGDASEAGGVIFTVDLNRGAGGDIFGSTPAGIGAPPGTVPEEQYAAPPPLAGSGAGGSGPAGDAGPGFFGKIKGAFNRFVERQKLSGHLKTLQGNLQQLQQQHIPLYAALGRELVDADLLAEEQLASLPGTVRVREMQSTIRTHEEKITGIESEIGADEAAFQDWLSTFGSAFSQLESAHSSASSDLETARTRFSETTAELNELLEPRLAAMDSAAAQLTAASGAVRAAPHAASNEQLTAVAQSLKDALVVLDAPLEALPDAVARYDSAKQVLADAETRFAELGLQLDQERATKAQRQSEFDALVGSKRTLIEAEKTSIATANRDIEQQYASIGEAATRASAAGTYSPPDTLGQLAPARSALEAGRAVEAEIERTNVRLEELK